MSSHNSVVGRLQATVNHAHARGMETLDARITPQRRQELYQSAQAWAKDHPRLTAFLAVQTLLSLPPILLFLVHITTLFLASTFAALALALTFVGIAAALASLILIPVLLFTSATAAGLFVAGYIAYVVAQKLATDPRLEPARQRAITTAQSTSDKAHEAILKAGHTANDLTGGRIEAVLNETQRALQTAQLDSSSYSTAGPSTDNTSGLNTPVSQPPMYVDQAQSYGISTPPINGAFDSQVGVARSTPNGSTDRAPVYPFDAPKNTAVAQKMLDNVDKIESRRTLSRPALF